MIANCYSPTYFFECCCNNGNDKFWGLSIDAIFTALITIGIFIFGFWLNKKNDERKEFDSLLEIKNYFLQLIEILKSSAKIQIDGFRKFLEIISEDIEKDPTMNHSSNFTTRYIDQIPNEKLFTIFVSYKAKKDKEKAIELYRKLTINIGIIRRVENEWESYIEDFLIRTRKWDDQYIDFLTVIFDFTDKMIYSLTNPDILKNEPFLNQFLEIYKKWRSIENPDDKYVREEYFIQPLLELCQKNLQDIKAINLLNPLRGCLYTFRQMKRVKAENIFRFSDYEKNILNAVDEIQDSLNEMNTLKDIKAESII